MKLIVIKTRGLVRKLVVVTSVLRRKERMYQVLAVPVFLDSLVNSWRSASAQILAKTSELLAR